MVFEECDVAGVARDVQHIGMSRGGWEVGEWREVGGEGKEGKEMARMIRA